MVFSYKLLSTLVDLSSLSIDEVVSRLTFSGFEVEERRELASASKLVIGQILSVKEHPDSNHLHLLQVDCGNEIGIKDIVCGAPNVRENLKVIVALDGCEMPFIGKTIHEGSIRGYVSQGMCCSLVELGVDEKYLSDKQVNGIEELPEDAPVGERNVLSYLKLEDTLLDINVLPNRPDCLSYMGMAREIASLFSLKVKEIPVFDPSLFKEKLKTVSLTDACPRLDILRLEDVVLKEETPLEIQRFLMASGIRPISPIVDLGNYVMLLSGQPFNMYDAHCNPKGEYVARSDYEGPFVSFDKKTFDIIKDDIVIFEEDKPVSLAGVLASDTASIGKDTTSFDIEAAIFYHANIRHTTNRLGASSFSSNLFCKGRNPLMVEESLSLLLSLLPSFLKSYTLAGYGSFHKEVGQRKPIAFSLDALNHRLGSSYTKKDVDKVLDNYRIEKKDGLLYPPIDRVDLVEQCDIEEEVFRFYGASSLKPGLDSYPITLGGLTPAQKMRNDIRHLLLARGFYETLNYTLIDEKMDQSIRVFDKGESYVLFNPMTKDHEVVRSDLLPSMLKTLDYNIAHGHKDLAFYEISNVDNKKGSHLYLSLALLGSCSLTEGYKARPYDFFDMKGVVEAIFDRLGISKNRYRISYSKNESFHPTKSVDVYCGKDLVATYGALHPSIRKDNLYVAEIDLGCLTALKGLKSRFEDYPNQVKVVRDLSFEIKKDVTYKQLCDVIRSVKNTDLVDLSFFDDFKDERTKKEYYGVSLVFGHSDRTLKSEEVDDSILRIVGEVKARLGLALKGE